MLFLEASMSKDEKKYPPVFKNDQNLSKYRWNALETEWVNVYGVIAVALDRSSFSQDAASYDQV